MTHPHERRGEIGGTRRPESHKPRWRHWLWRVDWAWRRLVPLLCIFLAAYAVWGLSGKVDKTQSQVEAQREGRRVALDVLCGGLYGVQEAGRLILLGELPPPAPPSPQLSSSERMARERYARSYAQVISRRVLEEAQIDANLVLRDDGTVDCARLKVITAATSGGRLPTPPPAGSP